MGELTVHINKRFFLEVCIGIEGLCAELYHYYSRIYENVPEASRLWKKTALEEENHQKQFELALRLISETEFSISKESLKRAYLIQQNLQNLLEQHKNNKPDLLAAVTKAVEMEEKLADLHAHSSLHFSEESMQSLFNSLNKADFDHVAEMQRYRNNLFFPPCETGGN
jgi:rubrerythrin